MHERLVNGGLFVDLADRVLAAFTIWDASDDDTASIELCTVLVSIHNLMTHDVVSDEVIEDLHFIAHESPVL